MHTSRNLSLLRLVIKIRVMINTFRPSEHTKIKSKTNVGKEMKYIEILLLNPWIRFMIQIAISILVNRYSLVKVYTRNYTRMIKRYEIEKHNNKNQAVHRIQTDLNMARH